jgi:hypothetical protein
MHRVGDRVWHRRALGSYGTITHVDPVTTFCTVHWGSESWASQGHGRWSVHHAEFLGRFRADDVDVVAWLLED